MIMLIKSRDFRYPISELYTGILFACDVIEMKTLFYIISVCLKSESVSFLTVRPDYIRDAFGIIYRS